MKTKDEALKLALEYVELVPDDRYNAEHIDREALVTAIKEALAQPEQEPVAWMTYSNDLILFHKTRAEALNWQTQPNPLYTTPPQRKPWVGLTDEEIARVVSLAGFSPDWVEANIATQIVRVLEAKLKEKNT